jgi:high affinity Mn2+ porin
VTGSTLRRYLSGSRLHHARGGPPPPLRRGEEARHRSTFLRGLLVGLASAGAIASSALAQSAQPPTSPNADAQSDRFALLGQTTFTEQGEAAFRSPYRGPNSLDPAARGQETFDATLYGGVRLWKGAQAWVDGEVDQGFGLSNTLGLAGFSSGEAYKVGASTPYTKIQRLFFQQTIDLGGEVQKVDAGQNQMAQAYTANRLVLWLGKMSVGDVFDNNQYTLDPRLYFLNWSVINAASFDYAANAWGYTDGVAAEWYQGPWTARLGLYDMSTVPNGEQIDPKFDEFQIVVEGERRYTVFGQPGVIKLTAYDSRARMGDFADAIRLAEATDTAPSVLAVRQYRGHAGISYNWAQQINTELGVFSRLGGADGHQQSYEFTDVDNTFSLGAALTGQRWKRPDDTVGVAFVTNGISKDFQAYLNDGGLGILVGDGKLPHPGREDIVETYYSYAAAKWAKITFDYQFVENPAYNSDRGPVSIFGVRLHLTVASLLTGQ